MPLKWKKVWVSDERYESATVFDVNNDGILDIVSGAFWYEGPDFKKKHFIGNVRAEGEYYDDFSTIPIDVNGDGFIDFITGGWWGGKLVWKENPKGDPNKTWTEHIIDYTGNIESTRAWDIDGDGKLEIFPNTPCTRDVKYYKLQQKKNQEKHFEKITVFEFQEGKIQGHGLGVGDISGNGKLDIVLSKGWLERANFSSNENWIWHEEFDFGFNNASVPIIVADVNQDGLNDIIAGNAHGYGLIWLEQQKDNKGNRSWIKHHIDPFNAQYHDMIWIDIDGDGENELLTGKRHRAHCGNDPGEYDNLGIYYFKWTGEGFSKQIIDYGPIGLGGKGCGIHFAVADLRGRGVLDIIAPGKDGLYIYYNEGF